MRLGMIGTGRIANRFVPEARTVDNLHITAVYNPRLSSAEGFAEKWDIPFCTAEWDLFCEQVEAVYVASPHDTHYEYCKQLLLQGKHVLCEKPLCFQGEKARELFLFAKERNLILMEAVKTAYCPGFLELIRIAKSGKIGEIKDVEACFTKLEDPDGRELNSALYAGSFYEMGTYTLLPIIKLLGKPNGIWTQAIRTGKRNADGFMKVHLLYEEAFALAKTGLTVKSEGCLIVSGTKGYILAQSPWWLTKKFEVRFEDANATEIHEFEFWGQGLRYEITAFLNRIKYVEGKTKRDNIGVSEEESVWLAEIMENVNDKELGE